MARKEVVGDRFIQSVEVPERSEMKVDKSGKRKVRKEKLLPGYILVQVNKETIEDEEGNTEMVFPAITQDTIKQTFNVISFANMNKKQPRPMRPREVEGIFKLVDSAHIEVKQNLLTDYQAGDILDVVSGPFAGQKCEVINVQGTKILGQLDMFGRIIPAEFTLDQVYKPV